jgi:hypothetical protein
MKDSFNKELKHVFYQFLKYYMKIFLVDINAKVEREDIFKPTNRNEGLHEISSDNVVSDICHIKKSYLLDFLMWQRSLLLPIRTQCSHTATFTNTLGLLLMEKCTE